MELPAPLIGDSAESGVGRGRLILICGLPGAGKTTLAKRLEVELGAILMSPDEWIEALLDGSEDIAERDRLRDPVENLQWALAKTYLRKGLTVILDNGFWTEEERTQYAMEALELGAGIELHFLELSLEELGRRVSARNATLSRSTWVFSLEELERWWDVFEPPTAEELAFYDNIEFDRFGRPSG